MNTLLDKYSALAEEAIKRSEGGITLPPLHLRAIINLYHSAFEEGRYDMRAEMNDCARQRKKDLVQS